MMSSVQMKRITYIGFYDTLSAPRALGISKMEIRWDVPGMNRSFEEEYRCYGREVGEKRITSWYKLELVDW